MIPPLNLLLATVEDDTAPSTEEAEPNNQYLTKRDFKYMVYGLLFLAVIAVPIFNILKAGADRVQCEHNLKAISLAMSSYSSQYDDRLPAVYSTSDTSNLPLVDSKGRLVTWATTLINIGGFDTKRSFRCPSSTDSEVVNVEGADGKTEQSTYGMYAPMGFITRSAVTDQGRQVLVAETANGGAENSYDPVPLRPGGPNAPIQDGFQIGWATGDFDRPTDPPTTRSVTRLAFRDTKNGINKPELTGRHNDGINVLFLDGHYRPMRAKDLLNGARFELPAQN